MATVPHKNLTGTALHEPKGVSSATNGSLYVADGAGSGTWKKLPVSSIDTTGAGDNDIFYADGAGGGSWKTAPGGTFGSLSVSGNSTGTTLTAATTWYPVTAGMTGDHLSGVTFTTNHLTILTSGTYRFDGSITFQAPNADTIRFGISTDGTATGIFDHISRNTSTSTTDFITIPLTFIHEVTANDDIYLMVYNESSASTTVTITDLTMSVSLMKETV